MILETTEMQKEVKKSTSNKSKTYFLAECALMAAILCVFSPITIPIGPIPITLGTFAVMLTGIILGWKKGFVSVLVFLLIGLCGIPVFSSGRGGFPAIVGPTGGYIWSYLLMVPIIGLITARLKDNGFPSCLITIGACIIGMAVCYALGTLQFMNIAKYDLNKALAVCVVPFIPFDFLKVVIASMLGLNVKLKLKKAGYV